MNVREYAYIGDAVWELFVREIVLSRIQQKASAYHEQVTSKVNAKFQHDMLNKINEELTEEEREIVRRGRNLSIPIGRRSIQSDYRYATAFEAIIGYWYIEKKERLSEFEEILKNFI